MVEQFEQSLSFDPDEGYKMKHVGLTIKLFCVLQVLLEFYLLRK